jgi:ABC-type multidrug transport system fused ATPase/permease subunit
MREEKKLGKPNGARVTRRLLQYLRPYRWQVALALVMTLAIIPMELAGPYLFHIGIDWYILPYTLGQISPKAATWGLATVILMLLGLSRQLSYSICAATCHAMDRTAGDVRSSQGNLRALATSAIKFP